jgi:hypothetical protein
MDSEVRELEGSSKLHELLAAAQEIPGHCRVADEVFSKKRSLFAIGNSLFFPTLPYFSKPLPTPKVPYFPIFQNY